MVDINLSLLFMIRSRLKFETAEDRRKAAEKIRAEAEQVGLKRFAIATLVQY